MKKKLMFVVNVDWFFVSHRLPIALTAIKHGYEVHLVCSVTDKLNELKAKGIIVHPLSLSRSGTNLFSELKTISQIYKVVKEVNPDVLHSVTIKPVLYGCLVARVLKVPVRVASISGLGYVFIAKGLRSKIFRSLISLIYRVALTGSKAIIFQNQSDRNVLRSFGAVKQEQEVFIRGSGVALEQYPIVPEPNDAPVVILVARLLADKGVNEFVSAAKILKSTRPDIRMALVGDVDMGNPKSISDEQLNIWLKEGFIEHWGFSRNVADTMGKANIIVLPSYREGLPKSLIEAAACGRAVITTDVPGCRDAIEPGKTGLLVPLKADKPLADAILQLVDDAKLRKKFGLRARQFAEEAFDINDVIQTHLSIYSQ